MVVRFVCEECVPCARVCPLEPRVVSRRPPGTKPVCVIEITHTQIHIHTYTLTPSVKRTSSCRLSRRFSNLMAALSYGGLRAAFRLRAVKLACPCRISLALVSSRHFSIRLPVANPLSVAHEQRRHRRQRANLPSDKEGFLSACKRNDVGSAWEAYVTGAVAVDKYMLSALVALTGRRKRTVLVRQLWRSVHEQGEPAPLDAHLSSDFITAFGSTDSMAIASEVLAAARTAGCFNTRVCNSYLAATIRSWEVTDGCAGVEGKAAEAKAAQELLAQMMDGGAAPAADKFSFALGTALLGRSGQIDEARRLVEIAAARGLADTVVLNTLIAEAARAGEVQLALTTLRRMEEHGPAPNETSYNLRPPRDRASDGLGSPLIASDRLGSPLMASDRL